MGSADLVGPSAMGPGRRGPDLPATARHRCPWTSPFSCWAGQLGWGDPLAPVHLPRSRSRAAARPRSRSVPAVDAGVDIAGAFGADEAAAAHDFLLFFFANYFNHFSHPPFWSGRVWPMLCCSDRALGAGSSARHCRSPHRGVGYPNSTKAAFPQEGRITPLRRMELTTAWNEKCTLKCPFLSDDLFAGGVVEGSTRRKVRHAHLGDPGERQPGVGH